MSHVYEKVYAIVRRIPKGRVLTYGLISNMLDCRLSAQGVGWALMALATQKSTTQKKNTKPTPWHRVINSKGQLSTHKNPDIPPGLQQRLLEAEGVVFKDDTIDLPHYLWKEGLLETGRKLKA